MVSIISGDENIKSEAVIRSTFSLNHLSSQQAVKRSFDKTQEALFFAEVSIPSMIDRETSDAIEEVLKGHFSTIVTAINEEKARFEKILQDNGVENSASFSNPVTYEVAINSSYLSHYITVLQQLDELFGLMEILRLHSIFDSQQCKESRYQWRQRFNKFSSRIIGHVTHSRKKVFELQAKAEAAKTNEDHSVDVEANESNQDAGNDPESPQETKVA